MPNTHTFDNEFQHRLGVLGLGEGRSILSAAQGSSRWCVTCVCDLSEALCVARQREFDLECERTTDYTKMLSRDDVDVIGVFTPDDIHVEHIMMALEAGKHVVCTKPVVDNLSRGTELLAAQQRSGCQVFVGHSYRFFQTFLREREDFEKGVHGDLISCEACYNGDKRKGSAGARGKKGEVNWLYSGLGHAVDLVYWYLGAIDTVSGFSKLSNAGRKLGSEFADCFQFVLQSEQGVLGQASGIYGAPRAHPKAAPVAGCTLRGDFATTTATNPTFDYFTMIDGHAPTCETYVDDGGFYFRWGGSGYHAGEFQNYLEHFAQCLETGDRHSPNLSDGLYVIAILEAMERSLETGLPCRVDTILEERNLLSLKEVIAK
ncbi:Gfo/Idh/MocA family oxidoreductase [Coraliomargarita sp. SDUM461004]|uniref:Gfo/Idh/MocA family oxidoreductase n=1 Tax=Thalassobacterium sedimentorum TaxID=3041258 RepID=A0ABU1AIY7_9BACT|nr:Gfo/Idh/MocA family oxidoreductase [Coraliomargarita sp. SDUM461004]MDQ8194118.1 Gfo/Idh/MocA family oxidoreductase [Coraliomargarita sp. SDUM461004]